MQDRFDVSSLFSTTEGIEALLEGGKDFGIQAQHSELGLVKEPGVIDLGTFPQSSIRKKKTEIPLGYEEGEKEIVEEWVLQTDICIANVKDCLDATIRGVDFLPNVSTGPVLKLLNAKDVTIARNSRAHFSLQLNVNSCDFTGHFGKWLILHFEGAVQHKPTSLTMHYFIMAVHIKVNPIGMNTLVPDGFNAAVSAGRTYMRVPPEMERDYNHAIRNRNLKSFIEHSPILHKASSLPGTAEEVFDHIGRLIILQGLEECHMSHSIRFYDLQCASIQFTEPVLFASSPSPNVVIVIIKVKGSNENRPKISMGDIVRIRPVGMRSKPHYNLDEACTAKQPFEMQGIVTFFRMAAEEVVLTVNANAQATCEFVLPPEGLFMHPRRRSELEVRTATISLLNSLKYQVRFSFDRCGFGFVQESIQELCRPEKSYLIKMMFPAQLLPPQQDTYVASEVESFNRRTDQLLVGLNSQQMYVVKYLLNEARNMDLVPSIRLPFIVFGPPGTGKTVTIVESIKHIVKQSRTVRILACAPSDAAADVICQRLGAFMNSSTLHRLNWWQRVFDSVPLDLLPYCSQTTDGFFTMLSKERLESFQVIVSTCGTAGAMRHVNYEWGFGPTHGAVGWITPFDFVFVDEACQALEAECLVPISFCAEYGQVVLAGDPYQLGPLPRSPIFTMTDSLVSLQQRILSYPQYHCLTPSSVSSPLYRKSSDIPGAFLVKNYRSHRDIFEISSMLFYGGELVQCGDERKINSLVGWSKQYVHASEEILQSSSQGDCEVGTSVMFIGCRGNQSHELDSPSYSNEAEITVVCSLCQQLLRNRVAKMNEIGIIGAYRSQVLKIRFALRSVGLSRVNVGSVEDFQGREVKVAIISTVLTDVRYLRDEPGLMGLLSDAKRFNVAVTRAEALTVLVGHPDVLYSDSFFKPFLDFCRSRNSCRGEMWENFKTQLLDEKNDTNDGDLLLNLAANTALLGYGRKMELDAMEAYYRDDIEWRSLL